MTLSQRKLFLHREFSLKKDGLHIKVRDLSSSEEQSVPYEEINFSKIIRKKQTDNVLLIITIVFGTFFLAMVLNPANYEEGSLTGVAIFLFIVTFLSGLMTYLKSKDIVIIPISENRYLEFFNNKPNKDQFEKFMSEMTGKITSYLKTKYGKVDLDMPIEPQLMNIAWLKDREIITEEEFELLKMSLINKVKNTNPIGFNN